MSASPVVSGAVVSLSVSSPVVSSGTVVSSGASVVVSGALVVSSGRVVNDQETMCFYSDMFYDRAVKSCLK